MEDVGGIACPRNRYRKVFLAIFMRFYYFQRFIGQYVACNIIYSGQINAGRRVVSTSTLSERRILVLLEFVSISRVE